MSFLQFFTPRQEDQWYYKIPCPEAQRNPLYTTIIEPFFPPKDLSRGRFDLPFNPRETALRSDPKYQILDRRVYLNEQKTEWVFYQVWQDKKLAKDSRKDLIYCHGINDYGGKFADHARIFLDNGYRVIVPDLPSHGRSTGLHAYVTDMDIIAQGIDAVICDVSVCDLRGGATQAEVDSRKRFIAGSSMGGFTALYYTLQYPPARAHDAAHSAGIRKTAGGEKRPGITGAVLLCPMLEVSPESRPSYLVECIARALAFVAGRLPFAEANRGKNTHVKAVEGEFEADPQTYAGKLRIATGLACLGGMLDVDARLEEVTLPFKVFHGTADRTTNYRGSQRLYERAASIDKEIQLYDGLEHVLLLTGKDEKEDAARRKVLQDMLEWLERH